MIASKSGRAWRLLWLAGAMLCAAPAAPAASRSGDLPGAAGRAAAGDAAATAEVEQIVEPLFARKDFLALDSVSGARELAKLAGVSFPEGAVRWWPLAARGSDLRLIALDFGASGMLAAASKNGYVAYAIVEPGSGSEPRVSWYHDLGRKLSEQGGEPWHPVAAAVLAPEEAEAVLAVSCSPAPKGAPSGVLILEKRGGNWSAARRLASPRGASLLAVGDEGVVFLAAREAPKGVLTGASPDLFRALLFYRREPGGWSQDPVAAAIPEVVSAAEGILASLRRGDKEGAARQCVSSDVVDQLLYFTPGWKGTGKVIRAGARELEFVYTEADRPTLRITMNFQNRAGVLLLASATGRAEPGKSGS